jgi:hypothetical protein
MIIFKSILSTFETNFIFEAAGAVAKTGWRELKIEQPLANLACPNQWNTVAIE